MPELRIPRNSRRKEAIYNVGIGAICKAMANHSGVDNSPEQLSLSEPEDWSRRNREDLALYSRSVF